MLYYLVKKIGYKMTEYNKTCLICGKNFVSKAWNTRYCSKECGKIGNNKKRQEARHENIKNLPFDAVKNEDGTTTCITCGKHFYPKIHNQKTCCKQCAKMHLANRDKLISLRKSKKVKCPICGTYFETKGIKKYCSEDCRNKAREQQTKITKRNWYLRNKDTEKCKESNRRSLKKQRRTPLGKLRHTVAERVRGLLKRKGSSKPFSIGDILMYTMEDLKNHLEAQFETNSKPDKEKMSWDNYGYI